MLNGSAIHGLSNDIYFYRAARKGLLTTASYVQQGISRQQATPITPDCNLNRGIKGHNSFPHCLKLLNLGHPSALEHVLFMSTFKIGIFQRFSLFINAIFNSKGLPKSSVNFT